MAAGGGRTVGGIDARPSDPSDPSSSARFSGFPGPLVDAAWLVDHLDDVRVADVRWYLDGRSGHEAHLAGHIPGAVWLDVDSDLSDPPGPGRPGRHPLPSPQRFAAAMSRAGIGDGTPVVAYDDAGGSIAARLWWLLHLLDHPVAVLDGGLPAWDGPLETGPPDPPPTPASFTPRPFPTDRLADADQVAQLVERRPGTAAEPAADRTAETVTGRPDAAAGPDTDLEPVASRDALSRPPADGAERRTGRPGTVVLDARTAERYAHGDPKIDPRPGHIPGARSAPWAGNLDPEGRFLSPEALRARYESLGATADREVVAYCGSGVTACHDLLALTLAGHSPGSLRLYPGSWSDWGSDETRPTEQGPDPTQREAPRPS